MTLLIFAICFVFPVVVGKLPHILISVPKQFSWLKIRCTSQYLSLNARIVLVVTSGVESYDVDIMEQKVTVKGNVTPDAVLQTVSKTGKKTSFWEAEAVTSESATPAGATA